MERSAKTPRLFLAAEHVTIVAKSQYSLLELRPSCIWFRHIFRRFNCSASRQMCCAASTDIGLPSYSKTVIGPFAVDLRRRGKVGVWKLVLNLLPVRWRKVNRMKGE